MKLLKIWSDRKKILEGISNSVFRKEHVELIATERMDICNTCEHIDREGSKCFVPGTQPCCGLCGCKLAWKTRSLAEGCDIKKWVALVDYKTEDQIKKDLGITDEINL